MFVFLVSSVLLMRFMLSLVVMLIGVVWIMRVGMFWCCCLWVGILLLFLWMVGCCSLVWLRLVMGSWS